MTSSSSITTLRPPPPPPKPLHLELTFLSAKHLKNINWRNGDIKPYVVFWLDSDRRLSTKPDPSGSTKPVWNETFPINLPIQEAILYIEILHSKPSETPNPLIGSVRIPLNDVVDGIDGVGTLVRKFELRRPSGRPQGKIVIKLSVLERYVPDYIPPSPYYYSAPPPPPSRDYRQYPPPPPSPYGSSFPPPPSPAPAPAPYYGGYSEPPYHCYYPGYNQQQMQGVGPYFDRHSSYGGPSAPVDYAVYDQKQKGSSKLGVGGVADGMSGLTLHEGVKYGEEKAGPERVESDLASRDGYSHYRPEY